MIKKNLKTARENRLMYRETEISMTAALFFGNNANFMAVEQYL